MQIPRRRRWHPTPVLLPRNSHGWRSLVGCSPWGPWGREESDTTEWLHFHFSLSCIGEGNGNPLRCSCLENPRDGGDWWAASMGSHRVGHDWSNLAVCRYRQWKISRHMSLIYTDAWRFLEQWKCLYLLAIFLGIKLLILVFCFYKQPFLLHSGLTCNSLPDNGSKSQVTHVFLL